jgi:hypothetical protein
LNISAKISLKKFALMNFYIHLHHKCSFNIVMLQTMNTNISDCQQIIIDPLKIFTRSLGDIVLASVNNVVPKMITNLTNANQDQLISYTKFI